MLKEKKYIDAPFMLANRYILSNFLTTNSSYVELLKTETEL